MTHAIIWGITASVMTMVFGGLALLFIHENQANIPNWKAFITEWWAERKRK